MEGTVSRRIALAQYQGLVNLLRERGISFDILTTEELSKLSDIELSGVIRTLRDLSRTPVG